MKWWPYFLLVITGIILYSGSLKTYAFTDAYDFLYSSNKAEFIDVFLQGGRPLYGLAMKWSYSSIENIDDLRIFRLISLIFSLGLCSFFYRYLKSLEYREFDSSFLALVLLFSPALSIKIVWSVLWIMPLMVLLSFLSGALLVNFLKSKRPKDLVLSISLGVFVLLTYQPIFTFSLIPLLLAWLNHKSLRGLTQLAVLHLAIYVIYFIIFKGYIYLFDIAPLNRATITFDIIQQLKWFFTGPMIKSFTWNFFFVSSGFRWGIRVLLLLSILVSIIFSNKEEPSKIFTNLSIFLLCMLAAYIPNLLSSDNWMSYRTMDALLLVPIIFIWHSLSKSSIKKTWKYSILTLFVVVSFLMTFKNVNSGFVNLQVAEYNGVKRKIKLSEGVQSWIFVPAPLKTVRDNKILKRVITDEFGRLSSSSNWVPNPMVKLALRSLGKSEEVEVKITEDENIKVNNIATIDVESLFLQELKED